MAHRRPGHLKSPEATAFFPELAPTKEAPYIYASSMPSLPKAQEAYSSALQRLANEDMQRLERRRTLGEQAKKDTVRIEEFRISQRVKLEKARKQEKVAAWQRMQADKQKREGRWTQKTTTHPFHRELWPEDCQLYDWNRANDDEDKRSRRKNAKDILEDEAKRRKAKLAEPDEKGLLRKEKKKLLEDQKETKARLDLAKVDQRIHGAKMKADMRKQAHEEMLAAKGHLDRSHSDFFTDQRLSTAQREKMREGKPPFSFMRSSRSLQLSLCQTSDKQGFPQDVDPQDVDQSTTFVAGSPQAGNDSEDAFRLGYTSDFDSFQDVAVDPATPTSLTRQSSGASPPRTPASPGGRTPVSPTTPSSVHSLPWTSPEKHRARPGEKLE